MAQSESLATAVNNSIWNGFFADDGTTSRVREGQVAIVTAFGNLTVPTDATINGIEIEMEGYSTDATYTNPFLAVSNDGGSSFSTFKNFTTAPISTNSGAHSVEQVGGPTELWGETWTGATAAAVQFKIDFNQNIGAVYFDYVKARIYYTPVTTYPSDDNMHIQNGVIVLNNGKLDIQ